MQAAAEYRRILEADKSFGPAANNLAWHLAERDGDLGEALQLAMIAKASAPEDPFDSDTVGRVHYKRASYEMALRQFNQALEELQGNPTI